MLYLCKILILPRLDYGSYIYRSAKIMVLRVLDFVQSAALHLTTGTLCSSPALSICAESSSPPLHYRYLKLIANLILSIEQNTSSPSFNSIHDTKLQKHILPDILSFLPRQKFLSPLPPIYSDTPPWMLMDTRPTIRLNLK